MAGPIAFGRVGRAEVQRALIANVASWRTRTLWIARRVIHGRATVAHAGVGRAERGVRSANVAAWHTTTTAAAQGRDVARSRRTHKDTTS